jgi:AhpC/TSA family.
VNFEVEKPYKFAAVVLLAVGAAGFSLLNSPEGANTEGIEVMNKTEAVEMKQEEFQRAKPLVNPTGYINADNVSIEQNIGEKVILLDMWTYSCVNCQRTLPHLKEWHRKYSDDGLLIIGNHAPEFDFEKKRSNVVDAVEKYNLTYPVVLDNEYGTWNAYNNRYWPQKYLIGVDGFIRYERIGEGRYDQTEQKIRELLKELKMRNGEDPELTDKANQDLAEKQLDSTDVKSSKVETPEIYFGSLRNSYLANGQNGTTGAQSFTLPEQAEKNQLYLGGEWNIEEEFAQTNSSGQILLRYESKRVNMVLEGENTSVRVYQDGELVSEASGRDVENGTVSVNDEQLYNLIENDGYEEHRLRLESEDKSLKAYTFTFG